MEICMVKKTVFCDVDGTLLNSKHQLSPLTIKAVKTLKQNGITFVIVSGRGPSEIYPIQKELNLKCPIISYGGALVLDENRNVLFHKGIKKPQVKVIIEFIEGNQFDLALCLYSLEQWIVKDKNDPRVIHAEKVVNSSTIQGDIDTVEADEISKLMCIVDPEKMSEVEEKIKNKFPNLTIVKSSHTLLEIMEKGITKATAIQAFCSKYDIPLDQTIAFGDNYNDLEMLELVEHGYLMKNAPDDLKQKFELHAEDHDNDGIYYTLKDMGLI